MAITPIWQDHTVVVETSDNSLDYSISTNSGSQIFTGKAYKRPGASAISFNIGDICAPYLSSDVSINAMTDVSLNEIAEMRRSFYVRNISGDAIDSADFSNDWSYNQRGTPFIASDPIRRVIDPRQALLMSAYGIYEFNILPVGGGNSTFSPPYTDANGVILLKAQTVAQYAEEGMTSLSIKVKSSGGTWSSVSYDVVPPCARYALYYVNAFGGWDSLLTAGNDKRVDNYTRSTYKKVYSSSDLSDRGTVNYRNDIERTISLVTDWMTDEESARMHHLFGSTNVLLHDLVDDIIQPVIITAKSWTEKTFRNNGAKLVNYQIDVAIAQDFVRL